MLNKIVWNLSINVLKIKDYCRKFFCVLLLYILLYMCKLYIYLGVDYVVIVLLRK